MHQKSIKARNHSIMERGWGEADFIAGETILINKPYEWTSFDVVKKIRTTLERVKNSEGERIYKGIKVGHAGTLDPLATGLLIICTGKFTKKIDELMGMEKEYTGTFCLGATTPSYDCETLPDKKFPVEHITKELLIGTTKKFTGTLQQIPPAHSATIIAGERAYVSARKGREIKMQPKEVSIHAFEITGFDLPLVEFKVVCSKGTYIRSLANDFGLALNSGAYLASLCRTRIGDFKLANAFELKEFCDKINTNSM